MDLDNKSFDGQQQRKNSKDNTEYVPTRCRITKPAPPKPATNPMQFVKVPTCPLYKTAQEQIKKAEEVKIIRQEVRDEAEDWQMNLDNWKSSRRKRQEHIIERVVEVKKLEQEDQERGRRKTKTFNEMMEERNKRRQISLPIFDNDDSNDLSDYGIGSSSSKTDSIKDVDTDDSSVLDEKEQITNEPSKEISEEYTYEAAIEDYRSRTKNLNNVHKFSKSSENLSDGILRETKKSLFEINVDKNKTENALAQKISEDFAQSQSIKERLLSLEKFTEQPIQIADFVKNKCAAPETVPEPEPPVQTEIAETTELSRTVLPPLDADLPSTEVCSVSGDTDPEDSGIHTTDVSCSVSQADESVEDIDTNSLSQCVTKLQFEEETPASPMPGTVPIYDSFPMAPSSSVEPPKEKPPPPPIMENLDTTKRIKKEMHIKRWNFLGLEESNVEVLEPEVTAVLPDPNSFREKEKQLYKKVQKSRDSGHSEDSGVELDKNREGWFNAPSHNVEEEISKKEREIIEMVEKEEQWRGNINKDIDPHQRISNYSYDNIVHSNQINKMSNNGCETSNMNYKFDDEVLKVEHELLQLEKEEMIRQRSRANNRHRYSLDNLNVKDSHANLDISSPPLVTMDHRKSMPEPIPPAKPMRLIMPQVYQPPVRVQNRKPVDYNQHWLIQEAEQRRLNSQRMKHIPDNVIQTLTQRVQSRASLRSYPTLGHAQPIPMYDESPDKMLSVSGKKKCSYCGNELGRGAAMIIESLCLFYHLECFKCCVCHMQLGDGLMGTDVRVRNQKLHCHNCYSSDDGLKFSCV